MRVIYDPKAGPGYDNPRRDITDNPSPPITIAGGAAQYHFTVEEEQMPTRVIYDPGDRPEGSTYNNPPRDITDRPSTPVTIGDRPFYRVETTEDATMARPTVTRAKDRRRERADKPPYRVPTMAEIAATPKRAGKVASTFSGGGGSSTGYEMAGFEVVWANEFVPAAADTYRANHPGTVLDGRDIRKVHPAEILDAIGLAEGELDLLDGSPPCQSFSTAGKREKNWGKVSAHGDGSTQRSDDLFWEYCRLLEGLRPKTFVAENVRGMTTGVAKGFFLRVLARLRAAGYRVEARLVDASWLGVPQERVRTIFVGVREDLGADPPFPEPLPYRYTVRDAISDLEPGLAGQIVGNDAFRPIFGPADLPSRTILAGGGGRTSGDVLVEGAPVEDEAWLRGKSGDVADALRPGQSGAEVMGGSYFSMRRLDPDRPAGTVQASEGLMASTNQVHPVQRRRLSIAELKRICSFPDDYVLTGDYGEQWARLGNSVPPVMMAAIASAIRDRVLAPLRG